MSNDSMREAIESLDAEFADLELQSRELISKVSAEQLYVRPNGAADSCGQQLLRSAAVVEQSLGGLTTSLWDDPFEWTLPETINTPAKVLEYLEEVEATRRQAFRTFESDADLAKEIVTPAGTAKLRVFLLDTLGRARHHLQRAFVIFDLLNK